MNAPLTLTAFLADGSSIERTYHVGGLARMVANLERIAPEYSPAAILKIEIAPYVSGRCTVIPSHR